MPSRIVQNTNFVINNDEDVDVIFEKRANYLFLLNQGADNITNTQYNSFDDVLFSASGFTFSIDATTGNLIATI